MNRQEMYILLQILLVQAYRAGFEEHKRHPHLDSGDLSGRLYAEELIRQNSLGY